MAAISKTPAQTIAFYFGERCIEICFKHNIAKHEQKLIFPFSADSNLLHWRMLKGPFLNLSVLHLLLLLNRPKRGRKISSKIVLPFEFRTYIVIIGPTITM